MSKMLRRAKELSQQAERVRELLETAPERIEQAKDIVTQTTSQLQQLRTEVQASIAGLRAETGETVNLAVRELNEGAPVFLRAGYALTGVDMELGIAARLTAHLERVEVVGVAAIRSMLKPNDDRRVVHGVLAALVKAEEIAAQTRFDDLHYCEVSVQVGPAPALRLRWRALEPEPTSTPPPIPHEALPQAAASPEPTPTRQPVPASQSPAPLMSAFTQSTYFEPRTSPAPAARQQTESTPDAAVAPQPVPTKSTAPAARDWKQDSLERFKKMPDFTKRRSERS